MSFKDAALDDIKNVFLNADEFAELRDVVYDGTAYEQIPVSLQDSLTSSADDEQYRSYTRAAIQGIYHASVTAFIARDDLGGVIPEQGNILEISDGEALGKPFFRKYTIENASHDMGLLILGLEAYDE